MDFQYALKIVMLIYSLMLSIQLGYLISEKKSNPDEYKKINCLGWIVLSAIIFNMYSPLLSSFIKLFIIVPIVILLPSLTLKNDIWENLLVFSKGVYCIGLVIASILGIYFDFIDQSDIQILVTGFTLSIAIFDGLSGFIEGSKRLHLFPRIQQK